MWQIVGKWLRQIKSHYKTLLFYIFLQKMYNLCVCIYVCTGTFIHVRGHHVFDRHAVVISLNKVGNQRTAELM